MTQLDCLIPLCMPAPYLEECLKSLQAQTLADFGLLVYDYGGDSKATGILKTWKSQFKSLKILKGSSSDFCSKALNQLVKESKAKYVAVQFPNDSSDPSRFEKQIYRLKNSSLVAIGSSIIWDGTSMGQDTQEVNASMNPKEVLFQQIGSKYNRGLFFESAMYQRTALLDCSPFDELLPIHYDVEIHANMQYQFPLRIANCQEALVTIRVFKDSIHEKEFQELIKVEDKAIKERVLPLLLMTRRYYYENSLISYGYLPY